MLQLQLLHLLKYVYIIYIFIDGYKGDSQKAFVLLKAASMRATLEHGVWCF